MLASPKEEGGLKALGQGKNARSIIFPGVGTGIMNAVISRSGWVAGHDGEEDFEKTARCARQQNSKYSHNGDGYL